MSLPLLTELLKATSRSFYLTLRVLPKGVRSQVGLAYLLARTTDTIADTDLVSVEGRLAALDTLRGRILGETQSQLNFGKLAEGCSLPAEKTLLERVEEALTLLNERSDADRSLIRNVLRVIISGQELDLKRFAGAAAASPAALDTEEELDDYTYRVAGCVGEFWTRICRAHLFPGDRLDVDQLLQNGVRFGKGLQLVNILRDIPRDLRNGRCYLPRQTLAASGLAPADLLSAKNHDRFRPLYNKWLDAAQAHLAAGWDYTNALPSGQPRLRLACAWPLLIGARTIHFLRHGNVLDETRRIKISRAQVRDIMIGSVLRLPFGPAWRGQFAREANHHCNCK